MIIVIFFFAVVVLFVLFLVGLLAKEDIGIYSRRGLAGLLGLALMPVELLLEACLRIGSSSESTHGNFEFPAAKCANCDCRSRAQSFGNPKAASVHWHLSFALAFRAAWVPRG